MKSPSGANSDSGHICSECLWCDEAKLMWVLVPPISPLPPTPSPQPATLAHIVKSVKLVSTSFPRMVEKPVISKFHVGVELPVIMLV